MKQQTSVFFMAMLMVVFLSDSAMSHHWKFSGRGDWSVGAYWSDGSQPSSTTDTAIEWGNPVVTQPGEVAQAIRLSGNYGSHPFLEIESGDLTVGDFVSLGYWKYSIATLIQTGGEFNIAVGLRLAQASDTSASVTMQDGLLETHYIAVGWGGPVTITQTGGEIRTDELNFPHWYSNDLGAVYDFSGGTLDVGLMDIRKSDNDGVGQLNILSDAVDMNIRNSLTINEGAIFSAVPGTTLVFAEEGKFHVFSTNFSDVSGIENLSLKFKTLMPFSGQIEAAGEDRGADLAGFVDNFAPQTMTLCANTCVDVVNERDNHPVVSDPDVLYVRDIVLSKGSVLKLNGNDVYCRCFLNMNATVDDSGGGTLTFLEECHTFDIAADPGNISPDGASTSELTVTLIKDKAPVSGELIYLSTDLGTLTSGGVTGPFVSGTTDSNGELVVTLTSGTVEGTATILAKADSLDWTTSCAVEMKPLEITFIPGDVSYTMIPAQAFGDTATSVRTPSGNPVVTLYGKSEVLLDIQLGSPGNPDVAGKTLYLDSAEKDAVGTTYIDFPESVVTDADGLAQITVLVEELHDAAPGFSTITIKVELAGEPMVNSTIAIDVVDNRGKVLELYEANIPPGPVLEPELWDYLASISGAGNIVNQTLRKGMQMNPYMSGSVNNFLVAHEHLPGDLSARINQSACGGYQAAVLNFLDSLRANGTTGGTTDWLFNGLDYGPIHVVGGLHVAAMIYPRQVVGSLEWKGSDTLVLDPWLTQTPVGAYYTWGQWTDHCSMALLSLVNPALLWVTITPWSAANLHLNGYYPANFNSYPVSDPHPIPLYDPASTLLVSCPVHVTLEDASGNKVGYREPSDEQESSLVWENTDILFSQFQRPDHTFLWQFAIPDQAVTVRVKGYDQGDVHLTVVDHSGEPYVYTAGKIQQDQGASIVLDPAVTGMVPIIYDNGSVILPDNLVRLEYTGFDPLQGTALAQVTVTNQSGMGIYGPLHLEVSGISPALIVLASPDGTTGDGYPYVDLTGLLTHNVLLPGQSITKEIRFSNSGDQRFSISGRLKGLTQTGKVILAGLSDRELGYLESWPMKQKNMWQTGRADFIVPDYRMNDTFFDVISWQTPSPGVGENDGNLGGTSMTFYDGAGPNGADMVLGTYHWPIGIQGMDRHTGQMFWYGNPDDGGEEIANITPAFSNSGTTVYVSNQYTVNTNPLMAFETVTGPSVFRHNGLDESPDNLGYGSPMIGPLGRIFLHGWYSRPRAGTDDGTQILETWSADADTGTLKSDAALYQDGDILKVIGTGRYGNIICYNGDTGAQLWSASLGEATDASPTIDPANGNIYVSSGDFDVHVTGLDKDGNYLWSPPFTLLHYWVEGENNPRRAQSAGCLSHDGATYYFQSTSEQGEGKLYAINTSDGSVKWSYDTRSRGGDSWNHYFSCPIVTKNNVIIVGSNEGDMYYAIQDSGTHGKLLDTLAVDPDGNARASATVSSSGQLYLPVRTFWTAGNGSGDIPDGSVRNLFTAFDLQTRLPVPDLATFAGEFGKTGDTSPADLDQDMDVDGKDIKRYMDHL